MSKTIAIVLFFLIGYSIGMTIKVSEKINEIERLESVIKSTVVFHNEKNHDLNACKNDVDYLKSTIFEMGEKCNLQ